MTGAEIIVVVVVVTVLAVLTYQVDRLEKAVNYLLRQLPRDQYDPLRRHAEVQRKQRRKGFDIRKRKGRGQ